MQTAESWERRWAPGLDKAAVTAAMDRLAEVAAKYRAQVWTSHDPKQADRQRHERKYFD